MPASWQARLYESPRSTASSRRCVRIGSNLVGLATERPSPPARLLEPGAPVAGRHRERAAAVAADKAPRDQGRAVEQQHVARADRAPLPDRAREEEAHAAAAAAGAPVADVVDRDGRWRTRRGGGRWRC